MENKYTTEDLKTMQAWPFERKVMIAQTRIMEWYYKNNGAVCVSFSGGKDSTVLLDLARRCFPDIEAVFVDTGLEYPELRDFVKTVPNVTWLKPSMNFRKVIETYGYPIGTKQTASNIEYGRKARDRGDMEKYNRYINGVRKHGKKDGQEYVFMPVPKQIMPIVDTNIKVSNKCCYVMKKNNRLWRITKLRVNCQFPVQWQQKAKSVQMRGSNTDAMRLIQHTPYQNPYQSGQSRMCCTISNTLACGMHRCTVILWRTKTETSTQPAVTAQAAYFAALGATLRKALTALSASRKRTRSFITTVCARGIKAGSVWMQCLTT